MRASSSCLWLADGASALQQADYQTVWQRNVANIYVSSNLVRPLFVQLIVGLSTLLLIVGLYYSTLGLFDLILSCLSYKCAVFFFFLTSVLVTLQVPWLSYKCPGYLTSVLVTLQVSWLPYKCPGYVCRAVSLLSAAAVIILLYLTTLFTLITLYITVFALPILKSVTI